MFEPIVDALRLRPPRHRFITSAGAKFVTTPDEIRTKIKPAFTDPARLRRSDPGHPEVCGVYTWYQKFLPEAVPEGQTAAESAVAMMPGAFGKGTTEALLIWVRDHGYDSGEKV